MLVNIDHVNIVVKDLEENLKFYRDLLGLRETMRARLEGAWVEQVTGINGVVADCVYLELDGRTRLELLQILHPETAPPIKENSTPSTPGIRHLAFRVDDLDAEYRRLRDAGVKFVNPPAAVPAGLVKHATGRKRLCYFHGPEGALLELAEFRPGEQ